MEKGHVRTNGRQQDQGVFAFTCSEWVIDDFPVLSIRQQVRAQDAAQRHKRNPFLRRLQPRVDHRTGRITQSDRTAAHGGSESRCGSILAERKSGGLERSHAARTD